MNHQPTTPALAPIENLVFEGGGIKGSAYAGSVAVLDQKGLYTSVRNIAGTSAGAITASLLATGGGSTGLMESVETTQFSQFIFDKGGWIGDIKRTLTEYGIHTGNEFVEILKKNIQHFSGDANLTFSQLRKLAHKSPEKFKHLSVIASNLTKQRPQIFSAETSPSLPIWQAVRASISIPLVFEPVLIGNDYFVDGGLAYNYPIDLFDQQEKDLENNLSTRIPNPKTLGFYLEPQALFHEGRQFKTDHYQIDSLKTFALGLNSYLYNTANARHIEPCDQQRTVFIDDLGISATDFSLPKEKIEALIESGRKAANTYFDNLSEKHHPSNESVSNFN